MQVVFHKRYYLLLLIPLLVELAAKFLLLNTMLLETLLRLRV